MKSNKLSTKIIILTLILFAINIFLILQLIPVFESQTIGSKAVNFVVFPANFIFEDLLNITSVKVIDYLSWIIQFLYDYIVAILIINTFNKMKGGNSK